MPSRRSTLRIDNAPDSTGLLTARQVDQPVLRLAPCACAAPGVPVHQRPCEQEVRANARPRPSARDPRLRIRAKVSAARLEANISG